MKCSEAQNLLSAFHDGELAKDAHSKMDDHLSKCSKCARELAEFKNLSMMSIALDKPVPPDNIWSQIEQQLDLQTQNLQPADSKVIEQKQRRSFPVTRLLSLTTALLIVMGVGWFSYNSWFVNDQHHHFTAQFGHYLDEFHRNSNAAQQILLANYESHPVEPDQAIERVGYRPAIADGLPDGYILESTHVMKMPCCTCVQSVCKRNDGSTIAIFEHDDKQSTKWFGGRTSITASCNDKQCCLIGIDDKIAASWKNGNRYITLIGVRDVAEVGQMVAWLDR